MRVFFQRLRVAGGRASVRRALCCSVRVCCISVASVVPARRHWLPVPDRPAALGRIRAPVGSDWSTVGKGKRRRFIRFLFFLPAVQTVHMSQVNKPGVEISAAVLQSESKKKSFVLQFNSSVIYGGPVKSP